MFLTVVHSLLQDFLLLLFFFFSSPSPSPASSSSLMCLQTVFEPWPPRSPSSNFPLPCCSVPVPYPKQIYDSPPNRIPCCLFSAIEKLREDYQFRYLKYTMFQELAVLSSSPDCHYLTEIKINTRNTEQIPSWRALIAFAPTNSPLFTKSDNHHSVHNSPLLSSFGAS